MRRGLACLTLLCCGALRGADSFQNSVYLHLDAGERQIPGDPVDRQFDTGFAGGGEPSFANQWATYGTLGIGYQGKSPFGVEAGFTAGLGFLNSFLNGADNTNGYGTQTQQTTADVTYGGTGTLSGSPISYGEYLSMSTFYVMPTLRVPVGGLFGLASIHTLGLQVGLSNLNGWYSLTSQVYSPYYYGGSYTQTDSYSINAETVSYALVYRIQQMLGRHASLGLDFTYQWASFTPPGSSRLDGSPLSLNFSGPAIKLDLDFWFVSPFKAKPGEAAAARRAAQNRRRKPRALDLAPDAGAQYVDSLVQQGDALMRDKDYLRAAGAYQRAITGDANNRWAWQGLGNARYYMDEKADALRAYEIALDLSNGSPDLEKLVQRLRAETTPAPAAPPDTPMPRQYPVPEQ